MTIIKRIGVFGGSFDPVHKGHMQLADAAVKEFKLDRVIFVPASRPPHKKHKKLAPGNKRIEMLKAAFENRKHFNISRFELNRRPVTYTYQTLKYFKKNILSQRFISCLARTLSRTSRTGET